MAKGKSKQPCEWIDEGAAFQNFAKYGGKTQSQKHIKPLHWYVACRLVLEGGFDPDDIVPRPPFVVVRKNGAWFLAYEPSAAGWGERPVLGGLKTKNVDVVVCKEGLGPVLAVSCKGMTGALRNLTNRMEETIGECTNLHITFPALVFGYLFVVRANKSVVGDAEIAASTQEDLPATKKLAANDLALGEDNEPVNAIRRFDAALREMSGRRGIRNDFSRYESVALTMVDMTAKQPGSVLGSFPTSDSPLRFEDFFQKLYLRYDERFVVSAPSLKKLTRRREWSPESPAILYGNDHGLLDDYVPRLNEVVI